MTIQKFIFMRIIFVLACGIFFFAPLTLKAKKRRKRARGNSTSKRFLGEWKTNGLVTKLYDTPLGEVFIFAPTLPAFIGSLSKQKKKYDTKVHSIQFELYKKSKERDEMRRYIVIDLKVRVFPAISKVKNPKLNFRFTRSMNGANSIKTIFDIKGESTYRNSQYFCPSNLFVDAIKKNRIIVKKIPFASLGHVSFKPYEIRSIRMIIDRFEDGILSSNINGSLYVKENKYPYPDKLYQVRSFGICLNLYMPKRRYILEISKPLIMFTDNPKEVQELPALKAMKYPYHLYLSKKIRKGKNLKRLKNPDEIYARALNLLEGKDLAGGVKLLIYIAKKKEHVLAMNQLGICYWRGIGVKQDMKKALKWFDLAGDYKLPEALNLGGVLKLRNSSKPHINKQDKGYIFRKLKSWGIRRRIEEIGFKKEKLKLSKYVRTSIFSGPKRSPKTDFWEVRDRNLGLFYNRNAYCSKSGRVNYLEFGSWRSSLMRKYPKRESLLKELDVIFERQMKKLDMGRGKKITTSIYYKAQLLIARSTKEQRESALKEAVSIFKRGEKLGNIECAIEVLHCKARLGSLKVEDFDDELYAKFSDHPLYYLLKYIVKNPNAPGVKEFLNRDYRGAQRIWQKKPDAVRHFLLALEGIYQYFHYGMDTMYYRMYYDDVRDIEIAYKHLDAAVDANVQDAVYLKGVYLLKRLYDNSVFRDTATNRGLYILEKIAKKGNMKARFHIINHKLKSKTTININWLKQLKPLRDLQFPEAWMLSSDILARSYNGNTVNKKVVGAYKKAASLGCYRAWNSLAMLYYKNGRGSDVAKATAEKYWKKFLEADKKQRSLDLFDPYWPNPKTVEVIKSYNDGALETISLWKMTTKKATYYFRKFYNFDHLKAINSKANYKVKKVKSPFGPNDLLKGGSLDNEFQRVKTKEEKLKLKKTSLKL